MRTAVRAFLLLAGLCAPTLAGERVQFVFKGLDRAHDVALLVPAACPLIGVQVDSGPRTLERNHVLNCMTQERIHVVREANGEQYSVVEMLLACDGGQVLVVKNIEFVRSDKQ